MKTSQILKNSMSGKPISFNPKSKNIPNIMALKKSTNFTDSLFNMSISIQSLAITPLTNDEKKELYNVLIEVYKLNGINKNTPNFWKKVQPKLNIFFKILCEEHKKCKSEHRRDIYESLITNFRERK